MSCTRSFQLRKQQSTTSEPFGRQQSASKDRRSRLQKQLSADQTSCIRDVAGPTGQTRKPKPTATHWNETLPETSLRIFTAFRNKNNIIRCSESMNNDALHHHEYDPLSKKIHKQNDEKININIFLAQRISEIDVGSDSESSVKAVKSQKMGVPCDTTEHINEPNGTSNMAKPSTADSRRALFRRKSATLNEMRPRLTRAMSAPIQPSLPNEGFIKKQNSNNTNNSKKRMRRKKIAPTDIVDTINMDFMGSQPFHNTVDHRSFKSDSTHGQPFAAHCRPIVPAKVKSGMNVSDIVTLVSLLSPGASDSEKEEIPTHVEVSTSVKQKPPLRKLGKSVSFQDDEGSLDDDPLIDLPSVLRRASLVPLASRIRLNRPPTAPPGSIFHKSNAINSDAMNADGTTHQAECSGAKMDDPKKLQSFDMDDSQITKTPIEIMSTSCTLRKPSIDLTDPTITFPEYVRSIKEKECWLLFQKMTKKGISVTYETILRGVLTPSEFRVVERKQKEINDRLNAEADADEANK